MKLSPHVRLPNSLRARLLAAIGLTVVLSVGITVAVGALLTRREVERAVLRDVSHQADLLAGREGLALVPFARLNSPSLRPFFARQSEKWVAAPLNRPSPYLTADEQRALRARQDVQGKVTVEGTSYLFAARLVRGTGRAFVLLRPTRVGAADSRTYVKGLLAAALAGAALAALAAFLLARAIARPVRRVARASRSLAEEQSPEPVPVEGAEELATLAASFNHMAAQLERARTAERSFLLSVSHELKTPLTAIRGYAEGLQEDAVPVDEAAATIRRESARLERLVRDLLDLARMNRSEFSVLREPIDLASTAHEVVRRHEAQARSFAVSLDADIEGEAPALGDADRTLQVASNLVENALRCTPAGGSVRVSARPAAITVEDTGSGLAPEEVPRAFDRFFLWSRYGGERKVGTGLGLAIVKQLTEGMGGTVEVESRLGHGTRFTVHLPSAPVGAPADDLLVRV